jgi:hypothetical protein
MDERVGYISHFMFAPLGAEGVFSACPIWCNICPKTRLCPNFFFLKKDDITIMGFLQVFIFLKFYFL